MNLEDTVDDDRLPFVDRYREALAQTISEEDFSAQAIQTIAEDWGQDQGEDRIQGVMFNLLDTLEDSEYQNEVDFRLASDDVGIDGLGIGDDPFEEERPNRYVIKGLLGSGGMGQVFEVHDTSFERSVAVKFLHPKAASAPQKMQDFLREAQLTAQLEHPNIFPVHDVNVSDGGMPYFSMRKATGDSLRELIEESRPNAIQDPIKSFNDRVAIIVKVCDALAYAHSQGIIHQDIKPSNIMIGEFGEVIVVDWGTARNLADETEPGKAKLQGTPIYMSPEQARREYATILSDVYCVGSTLFHLLTFRYPTWSEDPDSFWDIKKQGIVTEPTEDELRNVPGELLSISMKAMAAEPADRYQSILELRADLINYQRGLKVSAHKDTLLAALQRIYRLNKRAVWAAAFSLIVVVCLAYLVYLELMKSQSEWRVVKEFNFDTDTMSEVEEVWNGYRYFGYRDRQVYPISIDNKSPWSLKNGELHFNSLNRGGSSYNISYDSHVSGDIRVEWDYTPLESIRSVNCFIGAPNRFDGYMFHLGGGVSDSYKYMTRAEQFIVQNEETAFELNVTYRMRMEKEGEYIRLFVDDKLYFEHRDIDVFRGPGHQTFGFEVLRNHVKIDNIKISSRPLPQKISPIMVANSLFANQRFENAIEHYQDISRAYPKTNLDALATYRIGRCYSALGQYEDALVAYNDFRFRFADHDLMGYVLRDLGVVYARRGKWKQAEQYFGEIVKSYTEPSLRRSTYQSIELACEQMVDLVDYTSRLQNETYEKALQIQNLVDHWSSELGVAVPEFNSVIVKLPPVFIAHGNFKKILERYDLEHWPWAISGVFMVTGEFQRMYEHFKGRSPQHETRALARMGKWDVIAKEYADEDVARNMLLVRDADPEKIREVYPDEKSGVWPSYFLKTGQYEKILQTQDPHSSHALQALMGLGRYSEIDYKRFTNLDYRVGIALALSGREMELIEGKENEYVQGAAKAHASLILKALQKGDLKQYDDLKQRLDKLLFLIDWWHVDASTFERFVMVPVLEALRGDKAYLEKRFNEFLNDETLGRLRLPVVMMKCILGKELSEEDLWAFQGSFTSSDTECPQSLFEAIRQDIYGSKQEALKLYKTTLGTIKPHMRTIPYRFIQYRVKELE